MEHLVQAGEVSGEVLEDGGAVPEDGVGGVERAIVRDVQADGVDGVSGGVQHPQEGRPAAVCERLPVGEVVEYGPGWGGCVEVRWDLSDEFGEDVVVGSVPARLVAWCGILVQTRRSVGFIWKAVRPSFL